MSAFVLLFGMFQVVLGSTIPSGLYAIYERTWGLTRAQTTVVFSMYVVGVLLGLVFLGGLADRYGRKPAILLSVFLAIASSTLFLCAQSIYLLYVGRLFSGLSVGLCTGAFTAALGDVLGRRRGAALSAVITSGALAAGPLASACVAAAFPSPLRFPFAVHVGLLTVAAVASLKLSEGHRPSSPQKRAASESDAQAARIFPSSANLVLFLCCASAIGWAYGSNGMWQSVVPLGAGLGGMQLRIAAVTALMLGISALAQWVTMRLEAHHIIIPALMTLGIGLGVSAVALMQERSWLVWVATCVVGVGQGMTFRSSLSMAAECATHQRQASAISMYYIFGYVMTAVLPLASNAWSVSAVLWVMVVLCGVSAILFSFRMKRR